MGVKVKVFSMVGRGLGNQAYFADSFQRADQPFFMGDNWYVEFLDSSTDTWAQNLQSMINVSGAPGTLQISNPFGGGTLPKFMATPGNFNGAACWGRTQFVEHKIVSVGAVNSGPVGGCVFCDVNGNHFYTIDVERFGGNMVLAVQRVDNGATTLMFNSPTNPWSANDVARLEIVPNATTGHLLKLFKNGVLDQSGTDNSAGKLAIRGIPGFYSLGIQPGAVYQFQNYKCGTLPQISTAANFP